MKTFKQLKKEAPIFARNIRVWSLETQSSRKIQEEKAEIKRKNLWV
jgi:hypothetical protein